MENASKALIIAGAILLAIVIISLGLIVVNNVRSTVDTSNLSEQEIQSFNAKFIAYEGSGVSGSRVNSLIQQVIATNQATVDAGKDNYICIGYREAANTGLQYACISINKKRELYALRGQASTSSDKTTMGVSDVNSKRNVIITKNDDSNPISTTVRTGKTYKVEVGYINGLVQNIAVSEE